MEHLLREIAYFRSLAAELQGPAQSEAEQKLAALEAALLKLQQARLAED